MSASPSPSSPPFVRLCTPAAVSTFLRSLVIQGSWNYRTMLGSGFAFALLPVLRRIHASEPEALKQAVERHLEHFNAHPYLSSVALGAVARMEAERADPETVRRLKTAIRGPLGSLGDALIWATVLPGTALAALSLLWLGVPIWGAVAVFLLLFNAVHLGIRVWGFRAGVRAGREVGRILNRADLSGWTRRLEPVTVLLLGLLVGTIIGGPGGLVVSGTPWLLLSALGFVAGLLGGHRTWRPAAVLTVVAIGVFSLWGGIS
ncbi:MAG: PTS system mannose/fructose/sorbose family transporter subunit IID [Longimicrobiales bacterium]|nr:PTS system mannose/fructose/sorbose family transporter subunit IID [Longimicrobiales bacterium]